MNCLPGFMLLERRQFLIVGTWPGVFSQNFSGRCIDEMRLPTCCTIDADVIILGILDGDIFRDPTLHADTHHRAPKDQAPHRAPSVNVQAFSDRR